MKKLLVVLSLFLFLTGTGNAELITIGSADYDSDGDGIVDVYNLNLIWDDDNNGNSVVFLDYTNNRTDWSAQHQWADYLKYTLKTNIDPIFNVIWDEESWRMPLYGEMGTVYHNKDVFNRLWTSDYWVDKRYARDPTFTAYYLSMRDGSTGISYMSAPKLGLAVRTTQVTVVPEPGTFLLLGSGILGIAGISRRRKQ